MLTVLLVVAVVAVAAGIVYLVMHGIGKGLGDGTGDNEGNKNSSIEEEQKDELISVEENVVYIVVFENEYMYNEKNIELDVFVEMIKANEGVVTVSVKDDNASLRAYNLLTETLKKENIKYVEE